MGRTGKWWGIRRKTAASFLRCGHILADVVSATSLKRCGFTKALHGAIDKRQIDRAATKEKLDETAMTIMTL